MGFTPFRQSREFLRGRDAEERVAQRVLQPRGWYVIPAYDYSGPDGERAPKIQGAHDGIVLPDLGLARGGCLKWAEVKAKWAPTFTLLTNTYDHGIGWRKWRHYLRCQRETGAHVWLFIIEECSQQLLIQSLDRLGPGRVYEGDLMDTGGMVFWRRNAFRPYVLDEIPDLFDSALPMAFEKEDL